jgi:hypothetical protein
MKQTKQHIGLLVVALLSVVTLAVAPVSARHGADDTVADSSTSSGSGGTHSGEVENETETEHATEVETENEVEVHKSSTATKSRVAELKTEAQTKVTEQRSGKSTKTVAQLQQICENRKTEATNKLNAFDNSAHKHVVRLNSVYVKLKAYQATNNVTVANYATLTADADTKKVAAEQAVATLDLLKANGIDCATNTDPASTLTTIKSSARDARNALKAYRTSLKNIVVAFAQAKSSTDDSNTSTDDSSNTHTTPTTTPNTTETTN